jgi:hypothetical protein
MSERKTPSTEDETSTRSSNHISYKMLYTGAKLFYQTQDTIEINIYAHQKKKNCVELIAYDTSTGIELPRLYLNEKALLERIGKKALKDRVNAEQENMSVRTLKKFKGVPPTEAQLMEEETRIALSSFIMSRLQLYSSSFSSSLPSGMSLKGADSGGAKDKLIRSLSGALDRRLQYIPRDTDKGKTVSCVYDGVPKDVQPINVQRRRHSTDAEVREAVNGLNGMQMYVHMKTGTLLLLPVCVQPTPHLMVVYVLDAGRSVIARADSFCKASQVSAVLTASKEGIIGEVEDAADTNDSFPSPIMPSSSSLDCTTEPTSATSMLTSASVKEIATSGNDGVAIRRGSASSVDNAASAWK